MCYVSILFLPKLGAPFHMHGFRQDQSNKDWPELKTVHKVGSFIGLYS